MSIRFHQIIFFRFAILALLAFFSSASNATNYYWGQSGWTTFFPSALAACQAIISANPPYTNAHVVKIRTDLYNCNADYPPSGLVDVNFGGAVQLYGDSCPVGQTYESTDTDGKCVAACPAGATRDSSGNCQCPPGQQPDTGTFSDILNGYQSQCKAPTDICSRRRGQTYTTFSPDVASDGCSVSCSIRSSMDSGASIPNFLCTYTGAAAGGANGTDTNTGSPQTPTTAPNVPNLPAPPITQDPDPTTGACPTPGSSYGEINGQMKCVPPTKTDGTPNTPASTSNTQTQSQITTTTTQTNSDGSTTTTTNTTTIVSGTTGSGSGSGSGSGGGSNGNGSNLAGGDCDPRSSNYDQCVGLLQQAPSDKGQSYLDAAGTKVDQYLQTGSDSITQSFSNAQEGPGDPTGVSGPLVSALPSYSACSSLVVGFANHPISIDCDRIEQFKAAFAWFLGISTLIYIYWLATKPVAD